MTACMRWSPGRRQSWRLPGDSKFDAARYRVAETAEAPARRYVLDRHYSGTWLAAVRRYALFDLEAEPCPQMVGAAVLSVPAQKRVLSGVIPSLEPYCESLELGRFVLDDEVPANTETWFLQVFRLAAAGGIRGVVSFRDPVARQFADGTVITPGHVGTIYQAKGARYTGRGTPRTLLVLPDATVFSARAAQKIGAQAGGGMRRAAADQARRPAETDRREPGGVAGRGARRRRGAAAAAPRVSPVRVRARHRPPAAGRGARGPAWQALSEGPGPGGGVSDTAAGTGSRPRSQAPGREGLMTDV